MIRVRRGAEPLLAVLPAATAAAGCVLPWEHLVVRAAGSVQQRDVGSFHGSGLAACIGAGLAMLMLADRLLRPAPSAIREVGLGVAGALLIVGAALFTVTGGYPPADGSQYEVSLSAGLFLAGGAGVFLLLTAALSGASRRAGSRSPASSAAPAPR
jgi:hypothetical protein